MRVRGHPATGLGLGLLLTVATACGQPSEPEPGEPERKETVVARPFPEETFSTSVPRPLRLSAQAELIPTGARLSGETNLPDGTELMVSLTRRPVVMGDKVVVQSGRFAVDLRPLNDLPMPPGAYRLSVSTPYGDLQPGDVKSQLGSNYEALSGPLLEKSEHGSRTINYETKVELGGAANPKADKEARQRAYREHEAFAKRSCESHPSSVERLSGEAMSEQQRKNSTASCLREMEASRKEMVAEGVLER